MSVSTSANVALYALQLAGQLDPDEATQSSVALNGLTIIDWAIVVLYFAGTLGLGVYFGRQTKSMKEFFIGSWHLSPFLIGVSLFATLLSAITYLSVPGEAIGKGPMQLTKILGFPVAYFIVGYTLLPILMRQRVTSAYELLEGRLGLSVRLLAAALFVLMRLTWMSLVVFVGSKAVAVMFGVSPEWTPAIVLTMGLITVTYTTVGGLRAVVITDLMQSMFLYGGALMILMIVTYDFGGFGWFPLTWQSHWDIQPIFSADPSVRVTVLGSIVSVTTLLVCTSGGDQTCVQRFMATSDACAARRAYAVQLGCAALISVTLTLVGFALMGYYQANPSQLPGENTLAAHADDLFPRFIAYHLPPGAAGLVVAGMLAAALSSLDSGVNSITAVVMTDFVGRAKRLPETEKARIRFARCLNFGIGAAIVIGSSLMRNIPGNIMAVTAKTSTLLTPVIFCMFFYALFVPFARPAGVWFGTLAGVAASALVAFSGPIFGVDPVTNNDPISFQWIAPITIAVDLACGTAMCLLLRQPSRGGMDSVPTSNVGEQSVSAG